ncbi:DNA circularisation protein N-terminus [Faunimonas pinastri]|uniref:DNA circularisation protein N-terminus n=1 Tax=Faunimonas pinastri TaxID=1855383 RepID=A0A1H9Q917_9HYPH|nr:DNA circularization N-terminal domain-containing protein [Faunimonas pinastri]SER56944.1 DNA circularisation protein N-terminus [Faunimonas pinastri]
MAYPETPWRARLRPASFRGAGFKVEQDTRQGGRRVALHEFPKRDTPYAEDMGRAAKRVTISAYCIGPYYLDDRDALITALEQEGSGLLIHPSLGEETVVCVGYNVTEERTHGGYCALEINFVEAGEAADTVLQDDTASQGTTKATSAKSAATSSAQSQLETSDTWTIEA